MRRLGHRGRVDANHVAIVEAFRKCGARVLSLAPIGEGCPDLLVYVGCALHLIEVKTPKGRTKPAQEKFHAEWPVITVREVDMVPQIVADMRRAALARW